MIIVCQRLLQNSKITAITLFPFILLKKESDKANSVLINHEKIHLRQQLELGIVFFYLWYLIEYYYRLYHLKNTYQAYRNISFEREAYTHEKDPTYLKTRKVWSFLKYVKS